jgi:hypothetical protein
MALNVAPWAVLTPPADASDCTTREASLAEVKRIRHLLCRMHEQTSRIPSGQIRVQYCHHERLFDLEDGTLSVEDVDEEYCLSDVMQGCRIELTHHDPKLDSNPPFIDKHVRWKFDEGEWRSLYTYEDRAPKKYWVVVIQDSRQIEKLANTQPHKDNAVTTNNEEGYFYGNNVGYVEGCSCLEGNPCSEFNKYNCKDWANRFAVALENS